MNFNLIIACDNILSKREEQITIFSYLTEAPEEFVAKG